MLLLLLSPLAFTLALVFALGVPAYGVDVFHNNLQRNCVEAVGLESPVRATWTTPDTDP